jgi:hypothetical protein
LKAWEQVKENMKRSINENMSEEHARRLLHVGDRISHINAAIRWGIPCSLCLPSHALQCILPCLA